MTPLIQLLIDTLRKDTMNDKSNINPKTKKIALMGILGAEALVLSFIENFIPAIPGLPPGAKPGFSNIVTMFTADSFGFLHAIYITILKAVFAGITRGATAFFMSLVGGTLSTIVMCLMMKPKSKPFSILGIAVLSAISHNLGQLIVAVFISGTAKLALGYGPFLLLFAIITGIITGTILKVLMPALEKQKKFFI